MLTEPLGSRGNLAQVVRRNVGCHPDGDPSASIHQQVGEAGGKDERLAGAAVVVVTELDSVLVDIAHHFHGERSHPALGVTRGGSCVVAGGAEVALTSHERVAQRPRLHQAHDGVVNRRVTVRVIVAHHVAHHAGALGER